MKTPNPLLTAALALLVADSPVLATVRYVDLNKGLARSKTLRDCSNQPPGCGGNLLCPFASRTSHY